MSLRREWKCFLGFGLLIWVFMSKAALAQCLLLHLNWNVNKFQMLLKDCVTRHTCATQVKQRWRCTQSLSKRGGESLLLFSCQQINHIPHVLFLTWKNRNMQCARVRSLCSGCVSALATKHSSTIFFSYGAKALKNTLTCINYITQL